MLKSQEERMLMHKTYNIFHFIYLYFYTAESESAKDSEQLTSDHHNVIYIKSSTVNKPKLK